MDDLKNYFEKYQINVKLDISSFSRWNEFRYIHTFTNKVLVSFEFIQTDDNKMMMDIYYPHEIYLNYMNNIVITSKHIKILEDELSYVKLFKVLKVASDKLDDLQLKINRINLRDKITHICKEEEL